MDTTSKLARRNKLVALVLALLLGAILIPFASDTAKADDQYTLSVAPNNTASMYEFYSTYFYFNPGASKLMDTRTYMEYRPVGGTWKTSGSMMYYQDYEFTGLKPNTKYQTRLYYKSIYSEARSGYSKTLTFNTGPNKKPKVKSATVQAINVKKHRGTVYGAYTGLPIGKYTYYTYNLKITVKFKKKVKAKYVYINGKRFKGGKKTYTMKTKKLTRNYNTPRGKKYTVYVYTGKNKTWGGYSKLWKKNRKIK